MDRPLVALVLAGGTGSRLYPASRSHRPKQFLALDWDRANDGSEGGEKSSLLSQTVARADFADETFVVTRSAYADAVREHAPDAEVIVEPAGKDTGPALVYATHRVREAVGECVVLCLPSDHYVGGRDGLAAANGFEDDVRTGARVAAETNALVTFGVEPTRPDTGYGYVELGERHELPTGDAYYDVQTFHEKPNPETAAEYVTAGYRWNAGIFAWTPDAFLAAARDSPLEPLVGALERREPEAGFAAVEPVSVDRAVMERTAEAAVVPVDFAWDDLGSWDAVGRELTDDDNGNVAAGVGEVLAVDARDNVVASDGKHVSLVGVDGLTVVAWDDRVLVVPKEDAQRVREVVERLQENERF